MKIISWNVNGLRACINKGFIDFLNDKNPDIICLQETKLQPEQLQIELPEYTFFLNSAVKKGYSSTAIFTKKLPLAVGYDFGEIINIENLNPYKENFYIDEKLTPRTIYNDEGRIITLEFEDFYLVTCYTPNAKRGLLRIDYRMDFEDRFKEYLISLNNHKPVIICGDLNVAHNDIDLANPNQNHFNPGFSDQERNKFSLLLDSGFVDTFRHFYPDKPHCYTWWSYFSNSREKNIGWRIDYFLVSKNYIDNVHNSIIHSDILGSDHCPIEINI